MAARHPHVDLPCMYEIARAYCAADLSVLPIAPGGKAPGVLDPQTGIRHLLEWKAYQTTPVDEATLRTWFPPDQLMGIGIACGPVSGLTIDGVSSALEILDFDDEQTLEVFSEAANFQGLSELLQRLLHERTPGGA